MLLCKLLAYHLFLYPRHGCTNVLHPRRRLVRISIEKTANWELGFDHRHDKLTVLLARFYDVGQRPLSFYIMIMIANSLDVAGILSTARGWSHNNKIL